MTTNTATYEGPYDGLAFTLKIIEQDTHAEGWGQSPLMLYQFFEVSMDEPMPDEPGTTLTHYRISCSPVGVAGKNPMREMQQLTLLMESPLAPVAMAMASSGQHPPTAHALIGELSFTTEDGKLTSLGWQRPELPGTKLARVVVAITGKDDYLVARRIKDESLRWLTLDDVSLNRNSPLNLLTRIHHANTDTWQRVFGHRS